MNKDYYAVLGVERNATENEISEAYRGLALKYHPDRNPDKDAVNKFKEAAEAFEVLSNSQKKAMFDQYGRVDGPTRLQGFGGNVQSIFETFFNQRRKPGVDTMVGVSLKFKEAALGCKKEIVVQLKNVCTDCKGTGVDSWQTCSGCGGSGKRTVRQDPFVMQTMCVACQGFGKIATKICGTCSGNGSVGIKEETLVIDVPPGAFSGLRLRILGKGELDAQGERGDLYAVFMVEEHEMFVRNGCDILCEISVSYAQLVLGSEVTVPTLQGHAALKINPGTQIGTKLKLSGMGVCNISQPHIVGDMIVLLKVDVPVDIDDKHRELIEALLELDKKEKVA